MTQAAGAHLAARLRVRPARPLARPGGHRRASSAVGSHVCCDRRGRHRKSPPNYLKGRDEHDDVRNTTLVAVTRAPYATLAAFRARMGWNFPWYSSEGSDFNYDFHATVDDRVAPVQIFHRTESELAEAGTPWSESMRGDWPGISAFLRVGDEVFHTYSTFGRGIEEFHNGYPYLDLTALGRQEAWEEPTGRAVPLGLHVGGPAMRLPDAYDA
ncbi:DUF899 family protein [Streptomyces lydicus]|uniref:DUF899 family protein n=1 Tax=Streptomyces lydicus TaxID=47763 RepID=UPI003702E4CE